MTSLGKFLQVRSAPIQLLLLCALGCANATHAHGIAGSDAAFVASSTGAQIVPFVYLGAKHMATGYDHLLFVLGVIFFLHRLRQVALYVTMFSVGHSITLLAGVLGDIHANSWLVDAVIGLSVAYKAFDNLGGFTTVFGVQPDNKVAVLGFGLFHGFGLATKLQTLQLSKAGLLTNLVSFNVGVELGQMLVLSLLLVLMAWWRMRKGFHEQALVANVLILAAGFLLMGYQLSGYFVPLKA